ncbi:hypothetical protein BDP27DRAFT_315262 [Rhodocollybia butyracea]|uniref:Uncharacterized protein n=1 Tax=Rhodocollybia butyracea TaxID=206335 RepID=A0A9P5PVF5_9AGAR|nr:hypothetical protein BDP27DRAFT_315262 [Rhodocollybia butyracea]
MEIFEKLVNLEELRILAYQSTTTTRSVLTALLPVGVVAPKDRKGKEEDKHMDNKLGGQELRTSAHDYSRMETAEVDSETDLDSPLLGDHSNCKILCPKLSSLGVEHDPDLASIFMTKLVKSRKQHGCPISKVVILVYDPQYGSPSSPRPRSSSRHSQDHNQQLTNHNTTNNHNTAPNGGLHGATGANPGAAGAMYTPSARSSVSSWAILNDEYNLRSREDEELLRKYVKEVRFEYKQPLSQDLVPKGWPTDAYRRTCLPYSF